MASLEPVSDAHRAAVGVLLHLRDGLHHLVEANAILDEIDRLLGSNLQPPG